MTPDRVTCPRCGESLPSSFDRCDACGAELASAEGQPSAAVPSAPHEGSRGRDRTRGGARAGAPARRDAVPGIAWLLLIVGLAVGGMVGFALHSAIGPRGEDGAPMGPSDMMSGGAGGGAGMAQAPQMPPQIVEQVRQYKATLAKNPDDLDANIGLGNLEFDSSQWEKAIEHYSRALKVDAGNADVRVDRAIAYHSTGRNDVAKEELLRVTRERPTHKNAWLNLGVVMRETGDRPGAVKAWERYLELEPNGQHSGAVRQEVQSLKQAG